MSERAGSKVFVQVTSITHSRAKTMADILDITLSDLAERALTEYLDRFEQDPAIKKVLDEVKEAEELQLKAIQKRQEAIAKLRKSQQK